LKKLLITTALIASAWGYLQYATAHEHTRRLSDPIGAYKECMDERINYRWDGFIITRQQRLTAVAEADRGCSSFHKELTETFGADASGKMADKLYGTFIRAGEADL
jgi:hypothetical protein